MHDEQHPLAGEEVDVVPASDDLSCGLATGETHRFRIEDWADRLFGGSVWMANNNFAAINYAIRSVPAGFPFDDEIVYGHLENGLGVLVHISELPEFEAA